MRTVHARLHLLLSALAGLAVVLPPPGMAQQRTKPYKIAIVEDQPEVADVVTPAADPYTRVSFTYRGNMVFDVRAEGRRIADKVEALFLIDGQAIAPTIQGKLQNLPEGPYRKYRHGGQTVWKRGDIQVTMVLEAFSSRPPESKPSDVNRYQVDTLLVKYVIENLGKAAHKVAARSVIATKIGNSNNGALFAAPTHPNQILNGVQLSGKDFPDYVEVLERPMLKNPGIKAVFSFDLGRYLERPDKIVLTSLTALGGSEKFDIPAQKIPKAGANSACALFWPVKVIPPGGKREVAFAYGKGIACLVGDQGFSVNFGGSSSPASDLPSRPMSMILSKARA